MKKKKKEEESKQGYLASRGRGYKCKRGCVRILENNDELRNAISPRHFVRIGFIRSGSFLVYLFPAKIVVRTRSKVGNPDILFPVTALVTHAHATMCLRYNSGNAATL